MSMTNPADRVEIITSVQRRRRWTASEKVRIVEETFEPGMTVSLVARRPPRLGRLREKRPRPLRKTSVNGSPKVPGCLENVSVGHGVSSFNGEWRRQIRPRYATSSGHAITNFEYSSDPRRVSLV